MQPSEQPDKVNWAPFWKLVLVQSQNSFNEKGVQFILIPLGVWMAEKGIGGGDLQYILSALILIPFILFSPLAGWVSDRYCKTLVIRSMAALQILVLGGMAISLYFEHLTLALCWFSVFTIQATFFSPSKKGLVKDIVGTRKIGFASGILEITSLLALLIGQIGVFVWFRSILDETGDGWHAAAFPTFIFFLCTIPVALMTLTLPKYQPHQVAPFSKKLLYSHFGQLGILWKHKILRYSELGVGYFWFIGGTVLLMTIQMAQQASTNAKDFSGTGAILMAWLSGGSVLGGILASIICNGRIKMWVAAAGGIGMTLGCAGLALTTYDTPLFYSLLFLTGFTASGFLVPLNARLQDSAEDSQRGDVIAAGNLIDCLFGLIAVGFQLLMAQFISVHEQFIVMALLSAIVTSVIIKTKNQ